MTIPTTYTETERVTCWANTGPTTRCRREAVTPAGLCDPCRERLRADVNGYVTAPNSVVADGYWWIADVEVDG